MDKKMIQLRSGLYPCREVLSRGPPEVTKRCRRCGADIESLAHIVQWCRCTKKRRIGRHNDVQNLLVKAMSKARDWKILETPRIINSRGKAWLPDLIFYNTVEDRAVVVNVTI